VIAAVSLASGRPAGAHHAFSATYDGSQVVVLRGTIAKTVWMNPHTRIYVDVRGEHSLPVTWAVEAASPDVLARSGVQVAEFAAGSVITVEAYRARNGNPAARARAVTLADGRRVAFGSTR
jgi:hypothetical protein